jgi:hydroxylysine kinase
MIDFGDMVEAPLINDLAVAAAYQTAAMNDIFKGTSSLLSGYHQTYPLLPKELDLLPGLIMNRVAMSAIICEWRAIDHSDNQEYILGGIQRMWKTLETLLKSDLEGVATTLKNNLTPVVD